MTPDTAPEAITQADREAAAGVQEWNGDDMPLAARMLGGCEDDHPLVQAFARHRRLTSHSAGEGLREAMEEADYQAFLALELGLNNGGAVAGRDGLSRVQEVLRAALSASNAAQVSK